MEEYVAIEVLLGEIDFAEKGSPGRSSKRGW
jgi:hypothetical protein